MDPSEPKCHSNGSTTAVTLSHPPTILYIPGPGPLAYGWLVNTVEPQKGLRGFNASFSGCSINGETGQGFDELLEVGLDAGVGGEGAHVPADGLHVLQGARQHRHRRPQRLHVVLRQHLSPRPTSAPQ